MESLSNELLHKIFLYCDIPDRLLCLNLVNSLIRSCVPYSDITILDIPQLEKVSRRLNEDQCWLIGRYFDTVAKYASRRRRHRRYSYLPPATTDLPAKAELDKHVHADYEKFLLSIVRSILPNVGRHLVGIRFARFNRKLPEFSDEELKNLKRVSLHDKERASRLPPIEADVIIALLKLSPHIKRIEFGNWPVRVEALKLLPAFEKLSHLSVFGIGRELEGTLRNLNLTTLHIGGKMAPLKTADPTLLRRLILERDPFPKNHTDIPTLFPNLETLHVRPRSKNKHFVDWCRAQQAQANPVFLTPYLLCDERVRYIDQMTNLRNSNLFGSDLLNLASMVENKANAVPYIEHLNVYLPIAHFNEDHLADNVALILQPLPAFLTNFRTVKALTLSNSKGHHFECTVLDLFHLTQLETLHTLVLDKLQISPVDATSQLHLDKVECFLNGTNAEDTSLRVKCNRLRYVTVKQPAVPLRDHTGLLSPESAQKSIKVFDLFVRFILFKCDGIKKLRLNNLSKDGWISLVNYGKRTGIACPLTVLRIACYGPCHPFSLALLAEVKWPRLRELVVYCDQLKLATCIFKSHGNFSTDANMIARAADAFPKLSIFGWPCKNSGEKYVQAILDNFLMLRELWLAVPPKTILPFKEDIAVHPRLELVRLLPFNETVNAEDLGFNIDGLVHDIREIRKLMAPEFGWRLKPIKILNDTKRKRSTYGFGDF